MEQVEELFFTMPLVVCERDFRGHLMENILRILQRILFAFYVISQV